MLESALDLLKSKQPENIEIVWQIIQGSEELRDGVEKWFNERIVKIICVEKKLPMTEDGFNRLFMAVAITDNFALSAKDNYFIRTLPNKVEGKKFDWRNE